jgi:hypothetical protein
MKKAIALLALLVSSTSMAACHPGQVDGTAASTISTAVQHIEEDEAGWDCKTMGNGACTADELWTPATTQHESLVQCILNLEAGTERDACIDAAFAAFPTTV